LEAAQPEAERIIFQRLNDTIEQDRRYQLQVAQVVFPITVKTSLKEDDLVYTQEKHGNRSWELLPFMHGPFLITGSDTRGSYSSGIAHEAIIYREIGAVEYNRQIPLHETSAVKMSRDKKGRYSGMFVEDKFRTSFSGDVAIDSEILSLCRTLYRVVLRLQEQERGVKILHADREMLGH
jgi:hypothetical protein